MNFLGLVISNADFIFTALSLLKHHLKIPTGLATRSGNEHRTSTDQSVGYLNLIQIKNILLRSGVNFSDKAIYNADLKENIVLTEYSHTFRNMRQKSYVVHHCTAVY